ncbi:MAG: nucleotide exchange factor GrpE [Dehalococcoidia bacterium]|nr:nucleotide exchange factor GrpE [Dehalococcoidia bacterium]
MIDEQPNQEPVPAEEGEDGVKKALDEATKKNEEYLRMLQRLQADFNNYRRRSEQERQELGGIACTELAVKLLPALDDLNKAMKAIPADLAQNEWVAGVKHIKQKFESILKAEGLEQIEAEGATFDPWQHDAVLMEEAGDLKPGTVKQVFRNGFKFRGRVIRPAQVSVVKETAAKGSDKSEGKEK